MKLLIPILVVGSLLGGCFVRTAPHHHSRPAARTRDCPPSYHWDNGSCVHNGNGNGNGKKDHRR